MAAERAPAFVSYSSQDSELALRLTKDLQGAGADVWLDQLAIRAGQQWDREVQAALDACSHVVVVLSPAAAASDNVLDEIAYALDERKAVLPLMMQTCRIPLRLKRLHYIDFRTNYDDAVKVLCTALGLDRPDLEAIARQFHEGTRRTMVVKRPLKFKHIEPAVELRRLPKRTCARFLNPEEK